MTFFSRAITMAASVIAVIANTAPALAGGIHLDRSKDLFFDQFSTNTYSLQVLKAKNSFNQYDFIVGGSLQIDGQHWNGDALALTPATMDYKSSTQVYLTQATLDVMENISDWVTAYLSVADGHVGQMPPSGNNIFLAHAFFVLGDMEKSPLYATVGINTLPFGAFSGSGVWDVPLTGAYFSLAQAPQISIAYNRSGLNVSATVYSNQSNHANNFIYSFFYNKNSGNFNYSLGAGYLTDLNTDATGNHITSHTHRRLASQALDLGAVLDLNASIGYGLFSLNGEYDASSKTVNAEKSKPTATSMAFTFAPELAGRVTTFGISRSWTRHLNNVPASLAGEDAIPIESTGLKSAWGVSVVRNIFSNSLSLGANIEKIRTYSDKNTYTGTVELFAYL